MEQSLYILELAKSFPKKDDELDYESSEIVTLLRESPDPTGFGRHLLQTSSSLHRGIFLDPDRYYHRPISRYIYYSSANKFSAQLLFLFTTKDDQRAQFH
jgi:hypothetical protein